jgi:hypothetical protein
MDNLDQQNLDQQDLVPRSSIIWRNAIAVGLVFVVVIILSNMFREKAMEMGTMMAIVNGLILLTGIVLTQNQVRVQSLGGRMSFSQGLGNGMLFVLGVTLITVVFGLIFNGLIEPDALNEQKELAIQQMREKEMSKEEIDQAMKFTGFMFKPAGAAIVGLLSNLFFGFILSLIGAAVTSRNK